MSESKHTPGPWEVDATKALGAYGVWTAYGTHPGDIPGELYPDMICSMRPQDTLGTQEQRNANARLIAAAPDLLAALKRAVELYGKPGGPWNVPSEPGSWLTQAREAIAAAEEVR